MRTAFIRRASAPILAVALLLTATPTAGAAPAMQLNHWGLFRSGGAPSTVRAFILYDRTGSPYAADALKKWSNHWNAEREARGTWLPYVLYYQDNANIGYCPTYYRAAGFSMMSVCLGGIQGAALTFTEAGGHNENLQPVLRFVNPFQQLGDGTTGYGGYVVPHEFGHIMGLGHSSSCDSIMSAAFCPGLTWYTAADWQALRSVYGTHAD